MFVFGLMALVIAIVAIVRARRIGPLEDRVALLENDLTDLRRRFNVLQRQTAPPQAAPPEPAAPPPAAVERPEPPPPRLPSPPVAPAAPATPAITAPPEPPEPPKPPIDWERWIGIRGAAVLGGIALALAGLLFFQYSIQQGLISPTMRVTLGFIAGLACLGGSEWVRRRGYRPASEGLAGAGVVVLYAAIWAGYALYQLVPLWLAFLLMALVTATCGLLAVRRAAPLVAVLGTIGGFATPMLLSIQRDRPLGLFGYVLLLDLGLLAVGRRRQWGWIGLLGLAGTVILQVVWLGARTGPGGLFVALAILAVFAVVFALAGFAKGAEGESGPWRAMQAGALLVPFLFAIYFAARSDLGPHLWGIAGFAAILGVGASWSGRKAGLPALGLAAAIGSLAVLAVWLMRAPATPGIAWEAAAIACGFAAIYHAFLEWHGPSDAIDGPAPAAIVAAAGGFIVLLVGSIKSPDVPPWPWLAAWLVSGSLLVRQASLTGVVPLLPGATAAVAGAFALQHMIHARHPGFPAVGTYVAAAVGIALLAQLVPFLHRAASRRAAEHGAAIAAGLLSLSLVFSPLLVSLPTAAGLGVPLALGVLMLLAGTRLGEGEWGLGAVVVTAIVHAAWTFLRPEGSIAPGSVNLALGAMLVAVVVFVAWPFVARGLASSRWTWWAAATAAPLWFFPLKRLWTIGPGASTIGLVPVALGALTLAAAFGARRAQGIAEEARRSGLVGLSAVAISFASVAIPLQLDKSWITIGWALEGLGLVLLWRRLDHPGLKWFGLAHLVAAAVRLVPTEVLLDSYPRSGTPIVNWLLYTYLAPAAAMIASAWILARDEAGRARPFEKDLYAKGHPFGSIVASLGAILTIFVWINLAIADWYADGPRLTLQFGRAPARDLTVSIAWALYALILLGFGMARARTGLRWLSLGFLLVTIGKVFLYDLGELRDLYRVLSLVGLALSLLLVSVLYQRFVFRRPAGEAR